MSQQKIIICSFCEDGSFKNGSNIVKCDHCKGSAQCTFDNCKECLEIG